MSRAQAPFYSSKPTPVKVIAFRLQQFRHNMFRIAQVVHQRIRRQRPQQNPPVAAHRRLHRQFVRIQHLLGQPQQAARHIPDRARTRPLHVKVAQQFQERIVRQVADRSPVR